MPLITYVIPTRDRAAQLSATLRALAALPAHDADVIVVDDASAIPVELPTTVGALPARLVTRCASIGAACRNHGVEFARGTWTVMLDDDSAPLDTGVAEVLAAQPADVVAVGAEITLPDGTREAGGLPEVFIGCGVAIRTDTFRATEGYDASFHYYVEEYDLAARLLAHGRIVHHRGFRVEHRKVNEGRDMNVILERLVRNNGWVIARYAPDDERDAWLTHTLERYAAIAERESARAGYDRGVTALHETLPAQPRRTMDHATWRRFIGAAAARATFDAAAERLGAAEVAIVDAGKNADVVRAELDATPGWCVVDDPHAADAHVIGTLSPGPMLDALDARLAPGAPGAAGAAVPCVAPWHLDDAVSISDPGRARDTVRV